MISRVHIPGSLIGPLLVVIVAVAGPLVLDTNDVNLGTQVALFAIAGAGLSLLAGYAGQTSFGQGAFWALGAYAFGILTVRGHIPIVGAAVVAIAGTSVVAWLIARPLLQLRSHALAMGTLALAIIVEEIISQLGITGGAVGLSVPGVEAWGTLLGGSTLFRLSWFIALVALIVARNLIKSRPGRGLAALASDEEAAAALGVPVGAFRSKAFVFAAALAAVSGILYTIDIGYLAPSAFGLTLGISIVLVVIIGGSVSPYGSVVGAAIIVGVTQYLSSLSSSTHLAPTIPLALNSIIYGLLIVVIIRVLPSGLLSGLSTYASKLFELKPKRGVGTPGFERPDVDAKSNVPRRLPGNHDVGIADRALSSSPMRTGHHRDEGKPGDL